jgi:hypothetical protein
LAVVQVAVALDDHHGAHEAPVDPSEERPVWAADDDLWLRELDSCPAQHAEKEVLECVRRYALPPEASGHQLADLEDMWPTAGEQPFGAVPHLFEIDTVGVEGLFHSESRDDGTKIDHRPRCRCRGDAAYGRAIRFVERARLVDSERAVRAALPSLGEDLDGAGVEAVQGPQRSCGPM